MDFFAQKEKLVALLASRLTSGAQSVAEVQALLENAGFHTGKPEEMRALLDHCLCQVVDDQLDRDQGGDLLAALDLTVLYAAGGLVDLPCPLNILNDVLSSQTIEECSVTFAWLESKKSLLAQEEFFAEHKKKNAKVALLRLCNAMVKRLSKSNDTVFCGRILMFLATVLSISDRSGVNLMGKFNVSNATDFSQESPSLAVDGGASTEAPIDFTFYKKFWGLQKLFVNREMVHKKEHWEALTDGVQLVFAAFASQSAIDESEGGDSKKEKGKKGKKDNKGSSPKRTSSAAAPAIEDGEEYFAKFLTSPHLMSLELRDPNFRRHVLVQFLIFFQNLLALPAVGALQELSKQHRTVIERFVEKTEEQLLKIAPKGHRFLRSSQHLLHREKNWIAWKDRGIGSDRCPSLSLRLYLKTPSDKKPPKVYVDVEGGDSIASLKSKVADKMGIPPAEQKLVVKKKEVGGKEVDDTLVETKLVCDYTLPSKAVVIVHRVEPLPDMPPMRKRAIGGSSTGGKRVRLGTDELTRLWNCGSTEVEDLNESTVPSLLGYLEPAIEQMKENAAMTEEERKEVDADDLYKNDRLFLWRAQRLMAKSDVKAFEKLTQGEDLDEIMKGLVAQ